MRYGGMYKNALSQRTFMCLEKYQIVSVRLSVFLSLDPFPPVRVRACVYLSVCVIIVVVVVVAAAAAAVSFHYIHM